MGEEKGTGPVMIFRERLAILCCFAASNQKSSYSGFIARVTMKTTKSEVTSNQPAPISDAELAAILENSPWAKMEREAKEPATTSSEKAA